MASNHTIERRLKAVEDRAGIGDDMPAVDVIRLVGIRPGTMQRGRVVDLVIERADARP